VEGIPRSVVMPTEATEARQGSMYGYFWPPPPQVLPKTLIEKAIFSDEPFTFWGSGAQICRPPISSSSTPTLSRRRRAAARST